MMFNEARGRDDVEAASDLHLEIRVLIEVLNQPGFPPCIAARHASTLRTAWEHGQMERLTPIEQDLGNQLQRLDRELEYIDGQPATRRTLIETGEVQCHMEQVRFLRYLVIAALKATQDPTLADGYFRQARVLYETNRRRQCQSCRSGHESVALPAL